MFLKSLLAEYIEQKYGVEIPNECGVLDRLTQPQEEELEDSFSKNAGSVSVSRNASTAFKIHYTPERMISGTLQRSSWIQTQLLPQQKAAG